MKKDQTIKALIEKAERSLKVAKDLFSEEYYDFAISRAYYTMFYCAQALLFTKNLSFSKHSALISAFGKEFIKTGIFPKKFQKYITTAFEKRLKGDYEVAIQPSKSECQQVLQNAEEFLEDTKRFLKL